MIKDIFRLAVLLVSAFQAFAAADTNSETVSSVKLPEIRPVTLDASAELEGPAGKKEVSGLVKSKQWPGVYWVHNDSGDETRVYPVNSEGNLFVSARKADKPGILVGGVINSDWEDIALDASGRIIIAAEEGNGHFYQVKISDMHRIR
jgi:hypothetical protein